MTKLLPTGNDDITDLSLHREPLQDFILWCHLGVILSKTSVNQFVGLVLHFVFLEEGFFSLHTHTITTHLRIVLIFIQLIVHLTRVSQFKANFTSNKN